jgi:hypothetical protein
MLRKTFDTDLEKKKKKEEEQTGAMALATLKA